MQCADDVGHLVELAVVHLEEGMHDAPLHGLEAVLEVGYGPVLDYVGRVVEVIVVEDLLDVGHHDSLAKGIAREEDTEIAETTEFTEGSREME